MNETVQLRTQPTTSIKPGRPDCGAYLPTPTDIKAACQEIQSTWSDKERQRRRMPTERTHEMSTVEEKVIAAPTALISALEL